MKKIVSIFCILFSFACQKQKVIEPVDASCDASVCQVEVDAGIIVDENGLIIYSPGDQPTTQKELNEESIFEIESACFEVQLICR